jgi:hypothetical protein
MLNKDSQHVPEIGLPFSIEKHTEEKVGMAEKHS